MKKMLKKESKTKRQKYVGFVASSIDGFIAESSKSGINWNSKEDKSFYHREVSKMDAIIVGSNTYKIAKSKDKWKRIIVLTSSVKRSKKIDEKTMLCNPSKIDLKKLLAKYNKVGVVGGGSVYDFCLRNKMLDELYVTIEPLVFTKGVYMFSGGEFSMHRFKLQSVKKLNNNTLLLHYYNLSIS